MCSELGLYGQVIHDREQQHLRRDDHRRQGKAFSEGTVRYDHQGGGQRHTGQGIVFWRRDTYKRREEVKQQPIILQPNLTNRTKHIIVPQPNPT